MLNDWTEVRYDLDKSANFVEICNSPWYGDAIYDRFSDAEMARRHTLAREMMAREGVAALILTGSPNIYSMGGAVTWASGLIDERGMCQYMLLPRVGEPMLIYPHAGCHIEAARRMVSVQDVRGSQGGHFGKVLAERLLALGLGESRIGIVACDRNGPEYMGISCYRELTEHLPRAEFVFLPGLLHELTYLKSTEEIGAMARAGELAVEAMDAVAAAARPGAREYQLESAGTFAIMNGGGRVHLMMIGTTSMHDPRLVFPNPRPSHRILQEGDIVVPEIVAMYKGYSAKIGHPVTIGPPTQEVDAFFKEVTLGGFHALREQLMPGKTLEDVRQAGAYFRRHGAQARPLMVHGLDLITATPYISVDQVKARPAEMTIVPGMTFAIEITPINPDGTFGMFMGRTYAITEDGQRDLTPYPMDEIIVAPA
ncbi:MAG TPA: M24 family metallopeptidase [Anaerolineae bacterium]|nr:M24 family metallopeptidase [Anaerolineae bacterium]